jgi:hypothetical protein
VPRDLLPYDPEFVAANDKLRATLARDGIELDTQPVITTCEVSTSERDCARCNVATVLDSIDSALIDQMAIAFARWPSSVRKVARLEHVAFCNTIKYEGKDHGPAGLADPNTHRVYIGVEYFRGAGTGFSIEAAVHHEIFHLLDFETQGSRWVADREWHALNPAGFAYRDPSIDIRRRQGFVNGYASTDEMEDRASTFEYLMVRPDDLCTMTANDPILARKVRLLRGRVSRVEGADKLRIGAPCTFEAPTKKPTKKPSKKVTKRPLDLKLRR